MPLDAERLPPLEAGFRIDRYELLYALAQGGKGSVWIARLHGKHGFQKLFTVKTIVPECAADPTFRKAFLDQAHIASSIVHPNVAQTIELGEFEGFLYIAMEYVEGDSLQRILRGLQMRGERLPLRMALRIVAGLAAGLHAAHELVDREGKPYGIVHGDVTPHNVLLALNGTPKIVNFGLAKASVDRRADIWGATAVLYQLITGHPPYGHESESEARDDVLSGCPHEPLPSTIPEAVRHVVERGLARLPRHRFGSALELEQALEDAMTKSDLHCTSADVAELVTALIGERIAARRRDRAGAVHAVAERARVRTMTNPESEPTTSGPGGLPATLVTARDAAPLRGRESTQKRGLCLACALAGGILVAGSAQYAEARWGGGPVAPARTVGPASSATMAVGERGFDAGPRRSDTRSSLRRDARTKTIAQSKRRDEDEPGGTTDGRR